MDVARSPADSPILAAVKATARSRLTNGSQLFLGTVDGRSREARRWRDLYRDLLGQTGGKHEQLVRSLSSLVLRREQLDARIASGDDVDTDELLRLCGTISRLMTKLRLVADPDDEPVEDATEQAIAAARAHIRGEAA